MADLTAPDITIPDEALEAARQAVRKAASGDLGERDSEWLARAACLAMLRAWPGMWHIEPIDFEGKIILPLPQENANGEG